MQSHFTPFYYLLLIHLHRKQIRLSVIVGDCITLTSSRIPLHPAPLRHHVRSISSSQQKVSQSDHVLTLIHRYIFRRAAARAVSAPRQLRATPRIASFQSSIPSLSRSFYQSRILRAEEQKEPTSSSQQDAVSESSGTTSEPLGQSEHQSQEVAESTPEPTQTPASSSSSPQDAVSEPSGTTSEPVGQSEQESKPVAEQASELAEKAKETVSDVAAKTAQAVGEFTQQPQEKAQDAASEVSEQAQSAASSVAQATRNTARSARNAVNERFPSSPAPASKILYVGNLFFEVTAPQLEAEFGKYGEIANSRVVTDNRGLSKGFAYIEMSNQKEADAAIAALNQHPFQGRRMSVQYHRRRNPGNGDNPNAGHDNKPSKTLFIGNMSYQMSDRDLNGKETSSMLKVDPY